MTEICCPRRAVLPIQEPPHAPARQGAWPGGRDFSEHGGGKAKAEEAAET